MTVSHYVVQKMLGVICERNLEKWARGVLDYCDQGLTHSSHGSSASESVMETPTGETQLTVSDGNKNY